MSTRELVFEYTTKGARAAAKADERVRNSVERTGRTAQRNSASVENWMERNRQAINKVAVASAAAVGSILAAAPSFRAAMSGMRASFSLFAETVVRDVLPAGTNFGSMALDLVQKFRDLDESIRRPISALLLVGGGMAALIPVAAALIKSFGVVAGAIGGVVSALSTIGTAIAPVLKGLATLVAGVGAVAAAKTLLVAGVLALAAALIFDLGGARTRALAILADLREGATERIMQLRDRGRQLFDEFRAGVTDRITALKDRAIEIFTTVRDDVVDRITAVKDRALEIFTTIRDDAVDRITALKDRVIELIDIGGEFASTAREWVGGLIRGVGARASDLVDEFRDMASRVAKAFKEKFNDLIPSSISIPSVTVDIPDVLGGGSQTVGGGSLDMPQLDTGGRISASGLAVVHKGERIMPAAQVRDRGRQPTGDSGTTVETINIMVRASDDPQRQGRDIARAFERELSNRGAN